MGFSLVHKFESLKADGADATEIQPSNWNDEHDLIMDGPGVIGRTAAGSGPASVLALSSLQVPAGAIVAFGGTVQPTGWLWCNGTTPLRADYPDLFTAIGVNFGAGNGTTTFTLPNTAGRVLAGKEGVGTLLTSAGGGVDGGTLAAVGGTQTVTLTAAQQATMPLALTVGGSITINPAEAMVNTGGYGPLLGTSAPSGGFNLYADNAPSITNGVTVTGTATGGGQAHSNVQPTLIVNWIIKT